MQVGARHACHACSARGGHRPVQKGLESQKYTSVKPPSLKIVLLGTYNTLTPSWFLETRVGIGLGRNFETPAETRIGIYRVRYSLVPSITQVVGLRLPLPVVVKFIINNAIKPYYVKAGVEL